MSTAAMKELDKELYNELKASAGDFRLFYSDKKVHVIYLDLEATKHQVWEEMARREGFREISVFKDQLSPEALGLSLIHI